ncbi:MAG: hypothetical protein H6835_17475 [Planctomycetes bacterium]|nr:hypothetical protein [Planctomycetota bacterium]
MTQEGSPARALARVSLAATCIGWGIVPLVGPLGLLLVVWAFFVAATIVITCRRDNRPVARAAYATLLLSVLPAGLLHGA